MVKRLELGSCRQKSDLELTGGMQVPEGGTKGGDEGRARSDLEPAAGAFEEDEEDHDLRLTGMLLHSGRPPGR